MALDFSFRVRLTKHAQQLRHYFYALQMKRFHGKIPSIVAFSEWNTIIWLQTVLHNFLNCHKTFLISLLTFLYSSSTTGVAANPTVPIDAFSSSVTLFTAAARVTNVVCTGYSRCSLSTLSVNVIQKFATFPLGIFQRHFIRMQKSITVSWVLLQDEDGRLGWAHFLRANFLEIPIEERSSWLMIVRMLS